MSLSDRYNRPNDKAKENVSEKRPITCPKYEALHGERRCRFFQRNASCSLPDEDMCVEWLKIKGLTKIAPTNEPKQNPNPARSEVLLLRTLSDTELASFKALKAEACIQTESLGPLWLVPRYTGRTDRQELSLDHAATLAAVCSVFPGARLEAFDFISEPTPQNRQHPKQGETTTPKTKPTPEGEANP